MTTWLLFVDTKFIEEDKILIKSLQKRKENTAYQLIKEFPQQR